MRVSERNHLDSRSRFMFARLSKESPDEEPGLNGFRDRAASAARWLPAWSDLRRFPTLPEDSIIEDLAPFPGMGGLGAP